MVTPSPGIYPLSLHDALPIYTTPSWDRNAASVSAGISTSRQVEPRSPASRRANAELARCRRLDRDRNSSRAHRQRRSEEHTSELQSPCNLVCRLLLEKKKKIS